MGDDAVKSRLDHALQEYFSSSDAPTVADSKANGELQASQLPDENDLGSDSSTSAAL